LIKINLNGPHHILSDSSNCDEVHLDSVEESALPLSSKLYSYRKRASFSAKVGQLPFLSQSEIAVGGLAGIESNQQSSTTVQVVFPQLPDSRRF
jgi:hypothetical protein